jgi:hypothetical protein
MTVVASEYRHGTTSARITADPDQSEAAMQSLAWRWMFAILVGTAWTAIEPMFFR